MATASFYSDEDGEVGGGATDPLLRPAIAPASGRKSAFGGYKRGTNCFRLGFYTTFPGDHWMNQLAAWATWSDFTHVEIVFSDEYSASIWSGERAFLWPRRHETNYIFVPIPSVTRAQEEAIRRFCQSAAGKVCFDQPSMMFGRFARFFGYGRPASDAVLSGSMFCSELITRALQAGGLLTHLDPLRTSPKILYDEAMKLSGGFHGTNTYKFYGNGGGPEAA